MTVKTVSRGAAEHGYRLNVGVGPDGRPEFRLTGDHPPYDRHLFARGGLMTVSAYLDGVVDVDVAFELPRAGVPAPRRYLPDAAARTDSPITREMLAAAPDPVYGCHDLRCAEDVSHPANMLHWHPRHRCFYCEHCHSAEYVEGDRHHLDCPSLDDVLRSV